MIAIMGWIFVALIIFWYAYKLLIHAINNDEFIFNVLAALVFLLGIIIILIIYQDIKELNFKYKHKTEYIKQKVTYFNTDNNNIIIILNNNIILNKKEVKWLKTNNVYLELKYYKDITNSRYIIKE